MTAASPAVSAAIPVAIVAEPIHDRTGWTEESARVRTGWPAVIDAALEIMVAAGVIRPEQSTFEPPVSRPIGSGNHIRADRK